MDATAAPQQIRVIEDRFYCLLCRQPKLCGIEFWTTTASGEDVKLCEDCLGDGAVLLGYVLDKAAQETIRGLEDQATADASELLTLRKLVADIRVAMKAVGGVEGPESRQAKAGRAAQAKRREPQALS